MRVTPVLYHDRHSDLCCIKTNSFQTYIQIVLTCWENNFFDIFPGKKVQCPDPEVMSHRSTNPPHGPYFCGDKITHTCDMGYELTGDSVAQCTETREFKNTPECVIAGTGLFFFLHYLSRTKEPNSDFLLCRK